MAGAGIARLGQTTRTTPTIQQYAGGNVEVRLYSPHKAQMRLHKSKARFRVMSCGRRFGKTLACANEVSKFALDHKEVNCVWISPLYRQCKLVYRLLKRALRPVIANTNETELRIELTNGSVIEFYSAVNYDAIRGNRFHFVIMDECADINEDTWFKVIRPTLSDTNGRVIFIGTPKGRNWFWTLFCKGNDDKQPEWESFTFPTSSNPKIPKAEIEAAKADLPEDTFQQEYLATFLEESAGVFRGIDKCVEGDYLDPIEDYPYVIGWDVAKYQDFSVMTVLNCYTMHVDAMVRFNQIEYTEQVRRCKALSGLYNEAPVLMDITGVGDPVWEMLRGLDVQVEGYLYNHTSKKLLIDELRLAIENRGITFPNIEVLKNELRMMQYKLSPSRMITYESPKGMTDDCVNSLALARHAAGNGSPFGISIGKQPESYHIRHLNNEALMARQQQASRWLGDVELVVGNVEEEAIIYG